MRRKHIEKFILALTLFIAACAYRVDKTQIGNGNTTLGKPKTPLNFAMVEAAVFEAKCCRCHSNETKNSGNLNLETYANVRAALSAIQDDIVSETMPKAPGLPLSEEERVMLLQWIQMGAPEVGPVTPTPTPTITPTPTPAPTPDPPTPGLMPTFSSINSLIIRAKCFDCHNANGKASDAPFEKYEDIVAGFIVIPKLPDKSSLLKHILPGAKKLMPPPDSKYNAIAPEDALIIRQWILDGALNN